MSQFSFKRSEKLKSRKRIEQLFREGEGLSAYPFRIFWLANLESDQTQAAFSVPKRSFRKAVDRNRIKRQMREAYRLQKGDLYARLELPVLLMIVYTQRKQLPYQQIDKGMRKAMRRLAERVAASTNPEAH